jgi:cellulose synthase operon protein C
MSLVRSAVAVVTLLGSTAVPASDSNFAGALFPKAREGSPDSSAGKQNFSLTSNAPAVSPVRVPRAVPASFSLDPSATLPNLSLRSAAAAYPSVSRKSAAPAAAAPVGPGAVDESALRYYATERDTARVAAEIRRLKALHPSWQPPADLFEGTREIPEARELWELFAKGELDAIPALIEEIQASQPTWQPPEEFVQKYELAAARRAIVDASDAKDYGRVLAIAQNYEALLVCGEMDVLWRTGEALALTNAADRAAELYRFILARCTDSGERVATVQKAAAVLPTATVEQLMAFSSRRSNGAGEFDSVRADLFRKRIGELISDPTSSKNDPSAFKEFEVATNARRSSKDAELLGWYRYARQDWAGAAEWFRKGMQWERSPKAIEGLVLALRQDGKLSDAEALAYDWRSEPLIAKLFVELLAKQLTSAQPGLVSSERVERLGEVTNAIKSANGAQALGWYRYNRGDYKDARVWFEKAVAIEASDTNVLGLALSANRLKDKETVRDLVSKYGPSYPAVAAVAKYDRVAAVRPQRGAGSGPGLRGRRIARGGGEGGGNLANEAVALYKAGRYSEALSALERVGQPDQGLQVLRGWSYFHLGDYERARSHFAAMDQRHSTKDSQYGLHYAKEQLIPKQFRDN